MLKYEIVADDVRARIANGEFKPNDQLPTTEELCEQYDVSKITVKKAMDELVLHGLIARRRGSGSFVKGLDNLGLHKGTGWNRSSQSATTGAPSASSRAGHRYTTSRSGSSTNRPVASPTLSPALAVFAVASILPFCMATLKFTL